MFQKTRGASYWEVFQEICMILIQDIACIILYSNWIIWGSEKKVNYKFDALVWSGRGCFKNLKNAG